MINQKCLRTIFLAFSLLLISLTSFAGVRLERQSASDLEMQRAICIRGYEESYARFDLNILRAKNLKEYGERVFRNLAEQPFLLHPEKTYFLNAVDEDTQQVLGFAVFVEQEPHSYYLNLIVIDPAHQKQKIGTKLIFGIREIDSNIKLLRFEARRLNERAVNWYRKLGFQDDPTAIDAQEIADEFFGFRMEF